MNPDEIKLLESHARRGQELLSKIPGIPEEVIMVAGQHHENCLGRGYPHGLNRTRIHPLALLIGAVSEFCNLTLTMDKAAALSPDEALHQLFTHKKEELDPHTLKALYEIFKLEVPRELARISPMKKIA